MALMMAQKKPANSVLLDFLKAMTCASGDDHTILYKGLTGIIYLAGSPL
jgi:hypothetical protein